MTSRVPSLVGTGTSRRHDVTVINDDMSGAVTRDRNVLTGDSPLASNTLGKMAAGALLDAAQSG